MVRTILYATDLGLFGSILLQHVTELAEQHNARVVAVHAVEPLGVFADALISTYVSDDTFDQLRTGGMDEVMFAIRQQVLEAFREDYIDTNLSLDCIADVKVERGPAADVILNKVREVDADLIVMGSSGSAGSYETMLGSVASKVLQLSPVPVYMVPTSIRRRDTQALGHLHSQL